MTEYKRTTNPQIISGELLENLTKEGIKAIQDLMEKHYDNMLLELGQLINNWNLSAVHTSDGVLIKTPMGAGYVSLSKWDNLWSLNCKFSQNETKRSQTEIKNMAEAEAESENKLAENHEKWNEPEFSVSQEELQKTLE